MRLLRALVECFNCFEDSVLASPTLGHRSRLRVEFSPVPVKICWLKSRSRGVLGGEGLIEALGYAELGKNQGFWGYYWERFLLIL